MNERVATRFGPLDPPATLGSGAASVTAASVTAASLTAMSLAPALGASLAPSLSPATSTARPAVIQLVFRERGALYAAYMPLLTDGGLFVPTVREYRLGEDIYLLLSLPEDPQRFPVAGKVAWITPANASGGRTQGVGVRFPNDDKSRQLKLRIEEVLGTGISSSKPTQTL